MAIIEDWMFGLGLAELRLSTEPGTRADALYRRRGWRQTAILPSGEAAFALARPRD